MKKLFYFIALIFFSPDLFAQEAGEIQIYSAPTTDPKVTMAELHSNISPRGPESKKEFNPLHETIELTTGISSNFELGFYQFMRYYNGTYQFTGNHIRPRVRAPLSWELPVGLSLSAEAGYDQDPVTKKYNSGLEIRSIIDKKTEKYYYALNVVFEKEFTSVSSFEFVPNAKISRMIKDKMALGIEYYGNVGSIDNWAPQQMQYHQVYATIDLYLNSDFEFNFGVGKGLTPVSDGLNIKLLLGRKIHWGTRATKSI